MSDFVGTKCDGCGKIKGDANKWLKAEVGLDPDHPFFALSTQPAESARQDFCSDRCLQTRLGEVLTLIRAHSDRPPAPEQDVRVPLIVENAAAFRDSIVSCSSNERCVCNGIGCNSCEPRGNYNY